MNALKFTGNPAKSRKHLWHDDRITEAHVRRKSQRLRAWVTMLCNECCRRSTLRFDPRLPARKLIKGDALCCMSVFNKPFLSLAVFTMLPHRCFGLEQHSETTHLRAVCWATLSTSDYKPVVSAIDTTTWIKYHGSTFYTRDSSYSHLFSEVD